MEKIKNINVIFGGSFNPPTVAHYEISKQIIEHFNVLDFLIDLLNSKDDLYATAVNRF